MEEVVVVVPVPEGPSPVHVSVVVTVAASETVSTVALAATDAVYDDVVAMVKVSLSVMVFDLAIVPELVNDGDLMLMWVKIELVRRVDKVTLHDA